MFYKLLKILNFKYVKKRRYSCLVERDDIIIWRRHYLEKMKKFRQEGRKIYVVDETWLNAGHTKSRVWKDKTVKSPKQAFMYGLSTGNKAPSGRGSCLIITHIGSDTGFVNRSLWIFESKKVEIITKKWTGKVLKSGFCEILPLLDENAVIVLNNTLYHSCKKEKVPNTSWD